jgi:hypothetical protein
MVLLCRADWVRESLGYEQFLKISQSQLFGEVHRGTLARVDLDDQIAFGNPLGHVR